MSKRSLTSIDTDLSEAVKSRASATASIRKLSDAVIWNTRKIDELLAERAQVTCPDTPAELVVTPVPATKPRATSPRRTAPVIGRQYPQPPVTPGGPA